MSNLSTPTMKASYQDLIDKGRQVRADDARVEYEMMRARRDAEHDKSTNRKISIDDESARLSALDGRLTIDDDKVRLLHDVEQDLRATLERELIKDIRDDVFSRRDEIASVYKQQIKNETRSQLIEDLEPVITAELRIEFAPDIKQDLIEEVRMELKQQLVEDLWAEVRSELREEHREDVLKELKRELGASLHNELGEDLRRKKATSECTQVEGQKLLYPDLGIQNSSSDNGETGANGDEKQLEDEQAQEVFETAPEYSVPDMTNNDLPSQDTQIKRAEDTTSPTSPSNLKCSHSKVEEETIESSHSAVPEITNNDLPSQDTDIKRGEDTTPPTSPSSLKRSHPENHEENIENGHSANKKFKISETIDLTGEDSYDPFDNISNDHYHGQVQDDGPSNAEETAYTPGDSTFNGHYYGPVHDDGRSNADEEEEDVDGDERYVNGLLYGNNAEEHTVDPEAVYEQGQGLGNDFVKKHIEEYMGNDGADYTRYAEDEHDEYEEDGTVNDDQLTFGDPNEPLGVHDHEHFATTLPPFSQGTKRSLSVDDGEEDDRSSSTSKRTRYNGHQCPEGEQNVSYGNDNENQYPSETEQDLSEDDEMDEDEDEDEGTSEEEYSSEDQDGQGGYQVGYQGGYSRFVPTGPYSQNVPQGIIKETNTQETAIEIEDSDEGEETLVEDASFVPVNKTVIFQEEESLFLP